MLEFFIYFVITTVLTVLLRPKSSIEGTKPSALGDIQVPTAELGRSVPVVYGECILKGPNVTWYGDYRTEPIVETIDGGPFSSDQEYTKGYKYFLGMHVVWCTAISDWERAHGSGLVEYRYDDRRFSALVAKEGGTTTYTPPINTFKFIFDWYTPKYDVTQVGTVTRTQISDFKLLGLDAGGFSGVVNFHPGSLDELQDSYLQRQFGRQDIPAWRGYCHSSFEQCYWGNSPYIKTISAVVRRYPWFWNTAYGWNVNGDANPAAILYDVHTNPVYGLGMNPAQLGDSFRLAALKCADEGVGLSMLLDTQKEAKDFINEVLRHIDGVIYTDTSTNTVELKLARADYNKSDLLVLDTSNVSTLEMTRSSWGDTINVVKVKYTDRAAGFTTGVVEVKNQANIDTRKGVKVEETYEYQGLSSAAAASKVASRVLKTVSQPFARFTITANRSASSLTPGGVFMLNWPGLGIYSMPCRVTRISYGDLTDPTVSIDAVEDVFGELESTFTAPTSDWLDPALAPLTPAAVSRLVEAPFWLAGADARYVLTLASRANSKPSGYYPTVPQNGTYAVTGTVGAFMPSALLNSDVTAAATTLTLGAAGSYDMSLLRSASAADVAAGANMVLLDDELLAFETVTVNSDNTVTLSGVLRGLLDTLPVAHSSASRAWFITYGGARVSATAYSADTTVTAKLLPFTAANTVLSDTQVPALSLTTSSRAFKPYPVGKLAISKSAGAVAVTWAHRPRKQMLSDKRVVSQDYAGYSTGEGSYTVRIYANNVLKRTVTALTGTSFTYTADMQTADGVAAGASVYATVTSVDGSYSSVAKQTDALTV